MARMTNSKRHLNPLAIPVFLSKYLANSLWIILVTWLTGQYQRSQIIALTVYFGILLVLALIKYWWYRYDLDEKGITINSGLFFRKQVHIPYARIQTLQQQQWFYFKPFHVLSVKIETAGQTHNEAEGALPAVRQDVVDRLQEMVNRNAGINATTTAPSEGAKTTVRGSASSTQSSDIPQPVQQSYHINWRDLNTYALTSVGVLPILIGLGWLYGKLEDLLPKKYLDSAISAFIHYGAILLLGAVILILLLGIFISYLTIIQRYYHFELSKQGQRLVTEKGYFQRNTISANQNRIQAIIFRQTVFRQLLGLLSVQAVLASSATTAERERNLVILPVIDRGQTRMVHDYIDWVPEKLPAFGGISFSGRIRMVMNAIWLSLIPIVPIVYLLRPWGWLSLLLLPLAVIFGLYASAQMGIERLSHHFLAIRFGNHLQRDTVIVAKSKLQSVSIRQTIWMKRARLAHLILNVRQGSGNQQLQVRYLNFDEAEAIYQWYLSPELN